LRHHWDIELDLLLEDIGRGPDITATLLTHEADIRKEIMNTVVSKVVPQIVDESGLDAELPVGKLSSETNNNICNTMDINIPTLPDIPFSVRNQIHMILTISTDHPVNAAQALYAERGGIASVVAWKILKMLKREFLHVEEEAEYNFHVSGDTVTKDERRNMRSSADLN
jgi:hypothetical protein